MLPHFSQEPDLVFTPPRTEVPSNMIIGDRLRALREQKKLSQGTIEERAGLFRCYI
jgi:hypothetical protein